jgi:hypothetical protein
MSRYTKKPKWTVDECIQIDRADVGSVYLHIWAEEQHSIYVALSGNKEHKVPMVRMDFASLRELTRQMYTLILEHKGLHELLQQQGRQTDD